MNLQNITKHQIVTY